MADRITRPQGLGLTFSPGHAVGSPYGNAGAAMIAANKTLANTPDKTQVGLQKLGEGLKGLGSGIHTYQDEQQQAGLRRVLNGGDYNAPSVWDKITATLGHAADGTLGQHEGERQAIRSTPMDRNPQNIVIGANGRLSYAPDQGTRAQIDAEKLKQIQADNARAARDDARTQRPPVKLKDGKPITDTDAMPTKMKDEPSVDSTKLIPGTAKANDSDEFLGKGPGVADAGKIDVPGVTDVPGPVNPTTTATAGSPLSEQPTQTATPGSFDYSAAATNPVAINQAVTPGGDFNYNGQSPLAGQMLGPGDVYNAFDSSGTFDNSGGLASSFGPAPFQFDGGNQDASAGLYAGGDYGTPADNGSPMSDVPVEVPSGDSGGSYG